MLRQRLLRWALRCPPLLSPRATLSTTSWSEILPTFQATSPRQASHFFWIISVYEHLHMILSRSPRMVLWLLARWDKI